MIKVKIFRKTDGNIYKVDVSGHADYDEYGNDIVCSAVSAIVQTAVLGLTRVLGLKIDLVMEEGLLKFNIPKMLNKNMYAKTNIILDTMVTGLEEIEKLYNEHIEIFNIEGGV
ncbi:MAG TPA: ribosomal-processing cysteine protease Prp [Thermoanaerobacterales bacterium]|nr:ribosomal-processing cysteine protease Prp [Thermoanaerobacterales bacterium]